MGAEKGPLLRPYWNGKSLEITEVNLSQLTKILVILLSLFAIFLCGAMVSFVVNTNNYKDMYDKQKSLFNTLQAELSKLSRSYDEQLKKTAELQAKLNAETSRLEEQTTS